MAVFYMLAVAIISNCCWENRVFSSAPLNRPSKSEIFEVRVRCLRRSRLHLPPPLLLRGRPTFTVGRSAALSWPPSVLLFVFIAARSLMELPGGRWGGFATAFSGNRFFARLGIRDGKTPIS